MAFIELKPDIAEDEETARRKIIEYVKQEIPVRDRPNSDDDYIITIIPHASEGKIDRVALVAEYAEKQNVKQLTKQ